MRNKVLVAVLGVLLLTGCGKNNDEKNEKTIENKDYSFTNINWTRDGGHDTETIRFNDDGSLRYSCACGNPVNESDICETYTYNAEKKEITIECLEETEDAITKIKVIYVDETTLELDFNGESRKFAKSE